MKTRSARQTDIVGIRGLLANPESAVIQPSPFDDAPSLIRSLVLPRHEKVWVADDDGGITGFTQVRARKYVLGWEVVRLHANPATNPRDVMAGLVQEVLQYLQDRGIPRLFARTPADSEAHEMLLSCGFTHLLSECIFVRDAIGVRAPEETPVGMRYRMPQDDWPLRQLENAHTPLMVSQLEGLTSLGWSMSRRRPLAKDEPAELVVEREGELVGWVGWSAAGRGGPETIRLGLMTQSDDVEMASSLLDYGLHVIGNRRPGARIVVRLRDYQLPLHRAVLDHGFREAARETVHIKHGRLQLVPKKASRLFELAPTLRAFSLEPEPK